MSETEIQLLLSFIQHVRNGNTALTLIYTAYEKRKYSSHSHLFSMSETEIQLLLSFIRHVRNGNTTLTLIYSVCQKRKYSSHSHLYSMSEKEIQLSLSFIQYIRNGNTALTLILYSCQPVYTTCQQLLMQLSLSFIYEAHDFGAFQRNLSCFFIDLYQDFIILK